MALAIGDYCPKISLWVSRCLFAIRLILKQNGFDMVE